jgi:hypothetical protein
MVTPKKTAIITGASQGIGAATVRRMDFNWRAIFLFVVFTSVVLALFLFSRNGSYESVDGPAPIPPSEGSLRTIVARPWLKVSNGGLQLRGPAFDREGHLRFLETYAGSSNFTREKN